MCIVSMVHDQFAKDFKPFIDQLATTTNTYVVPPFIDMVQLKKLIDEFKECVKFAEKLDIILKQPDCVDPEKEKLKKRVIELEAILNTVNSFITDKSSSTVNV